MKVIFRDLYEYSIEDLVYDLINVDIFSKDVVMMPEPFKNVYINGLYKRNKLAFMPTNRPIIIPFRVNKFKLTLDYDED